MSADLTHEEEAAGALAPVGTGTSPSVGAGAATATGTATATGGGAGDDGGSGVGVREDALEDALGRPRIESKFGFLFGEEEQPSGEGGRKDMATVVAAMSQFTDEPKPTSKTSESLFGGSDIFGSSTLNASRRRTVSASVFGSDGSLGSLSLGGRVSPGLDNKDPFAVPTEPTSVPERLLPKTPSGLVKVGQREGEGEGEGEGSQRQSEREKEREREREQV
jgi:hypothetical protein